MTVQIDTTAEIDAVRLKTEGSHPSAPSSGHVLLYYVTGTANPGLYTELSNGQQIGPFVTGSGSGSALLKSTWNPLAPPSSPSVNDDEFDNASLDAAWNEYDPNSVLTVTESPNKYLILSQITRAGDNVTGIGRTIPAGDFSISTRISISGLVANYYQAGLALFEDATNTAKKVTTFGLKVNGTTSSFISETWVDSTTYSSANFYGDIHILSNTVFARIRRTGTTYYFDMSLDGFGWKRMGSIGALGFTPAHFGFFTNNGNSGDTIQAIFPFFRYVASDVGVTGVLSGQVAGIYG